MNDKYKDIIGLPHHVSKKRPQMPMNDRAAQFSPFSALSGYSSAINEARRSTQKKRELSDERKQDLDIKQQCLNKTISSRPQISVIYFVPDEKKSGGRYATVTGALRHIDEYKRELNFVGGEKIPIDDIWDIEIL